MALLTASVEVDTSKKGIYVLTLMNVKSINARRMKSVTIQLEVTTVFQYRVSTIINNMQAAICRIELDACKLNAF